MNSDDQVMYGKEEKTEELLYWKNKYAQYQHKFENVDIIMGQKYQYVMELAKAETMCVNNILIDVSQEICQLKQLAKRYNRKIDECLSEIEFLELEVDN